jgi:cell division protein FtsB
MSTENKQTEQEVADLKKRNAAFEAELSAVKVKLQERDEDFEARIFELEREIRKVKSGEYFRNV